MFNTFNTFAPPHGALMHGNLILSTAQRYKYFLSFATTFREKVKDKRAVVG